MSSPDYDSPWKEALDLYFQAFLAFFFPAIHQDIDWTRGFESLDKELQQIAPKAERGRRYVDKLVKVWRKNGCEAWVLIHVEVQTKRETGFTQRLFVYNNRIFDRYNRVVVSLAVLADDHPGWRPQTYEKDLWGWSVQMQFPAVKLLDYAGREGELEAEKNPFAKVVLAHLKARETGGNPEQRREWKFRLVRGLYKQGFSVEDVRQLFRLIDWLLELPEKLDNLFWDDIKTFQQEQSMPFITTPERIGIKKGMLQLIEDGLRVRFGEKGISLLPAIQALEGVDHLRIINEVIWKAASLEEIRQACAAAAIPTSPGKKKRQGSKRKSL